MSQNLHSRIEYAKQYRDEKLATGRTDPIAKMLIATLEREIKQLEAKYGREKTKERLSLPVTRTFIQHVFKTLYRLWNYKNRGLPNVFTILTQAESKTKGVCK